MPLEVPAAAELARVLAIGSDELGLAEEARAVGLAVAPLRDGHAAGVLAGAQAVLLLGDVDQGRVGGGGAEPAGKGGGGRGSLSYYI